MSIDIGFRIYVGTNDPLPCHNTVVSLGAATHAYAEHMAAVAKHLFGEPNARHSKKDEWRYGRNGSLSIHLKLGTWYNHETKEGGGVLDLICKEIGGDAKDAREWMHQQGFVNGHANGHDHSQKRKIVETFSYEDEQGNEMFEVVRFEPKGFSQRRRANGGYIWSVKGLDTAIPFRLPDLIDAIAMERPVVIVEGERKVDLLRKWNIPATCNAGGASKWKEGHSRYLKGADVIIMPDNDDAGILHADSVAQSLAGIASRIRVLLLPDLKPKGDVVDWAKNGGTPEKLWELVENEAVEWQPRHSDSGDIGQDAETPLGEKGPAEPEGNLITPAAEFIKGLISLDYVVDGLFIRGFLYSLTAMTGHGKTAIALLISEIASNRKRRRKLGKHDVEHVRVVYIACENAIDVQMRLIGMEHHFGFDCADLDLFVIDKVFDLEKNLDCIRKEVEAFGGDIGLVIIDTSAAMFQGDEENNNVQSLAHAKTQRKLCELPGRPCVISLTHPTKSVASQQQLLPRGGGAYLNEVDGNFTAWKHEDHLTTLSWTGKLRGPDFDPVEFRLARVETDRLKDSKGRLLPTVVAEIATPDQIKETEEKAEFQEEKLLDAMADNPGASMDKLAAAIGGNWNKSLVNRVMGRLEQQRLVAKQGRNYTLTKAGDKIVSRNKPGETKRNAL